VPRAERNQALTTPDADLDRLRRAFADDTTSGTDCPPAVQVWEAVNGQLDPADTAAVVDHVASCGACAEAWRLARDLEPETIASSPIPFPKKRRPSAAWPLLAAAAILVLAIGAWPLFRGTPAPAAPVANAVAPAPSSAPAPASAPVPEQTTAALSPAIEKAPVVLSASRVLVFRSQASADPFVKDFAVAIAPYKQDHYPEAITRLDALARKYPDADEPPFYLGVSLLIVSRPADAVAPLRRAANGRDAAIAAQARRYLTLATTR
jgi:hypothetical protein